MSEGTLENAKMCTMARRLFSGPFHTLGLHLLFQHIPRHPTGIEMSELKDPLKEWLNF